MDAEQAEAVLFLARYHHAQGDNAVAEALCTRCAEFAVCYIFMSYFLCCRVNRPLFNSQYYLSPVGCKASAAPRVSKRVRCCVPCRPPVSLTSPRTSPKLPPPVAMVTVITVITVWVAAGGTTCLRSAHPAAAASAAAPTSQAGASPGSTSSAAAALPITAPP